jgi:hypothetical protein
MKHGTVVRTRTGGRALLAAAFVLAAAALAVDYAGDRLVVPAAAFVHVRWAPGVDAAGRQTLERRFHLTEPEQTAETTYSYRLNDLSSDNIRDMVTHAAVADTQDIDRSAFALSSSAERVIGDPASQRRAERFARTITLLWTAAAAIGTLGILFIAAPLRMQRLRDRARAGALSLASTVYRWIPEVSAEGAALFRIVFGGALLLVFAFSPLAASDVPSTTLGDDSTWLMRVAGNVFVRSPRLADFINPWLLAWGSLFVAGALTRWSFAMLTAGALAWGVVYSLNSGHHPISALLVALLCLLPSRWGDAWSVDAWMRRPRQAAPREYGYSVSIPGVVLGLALAAAAASKLQEGGLGWITSGTVKYHFVTDAPNAPVDWGLRYGVIPSVAVALSLGTIAIEALVLPVALFGSPPVRTIAALAVSAMFAGFWLFQGVAWPAWWVLLLSLAPWHRVAAGRRTTAAQAAPAGRLTLRYLQAAIVVIVIGQQLIASTGRLEVPPLLSAYDMYSKTYASPREYPADGGSAYWLTATRTDGTMQSCRVGKDEARVPVAAQVLASCFGSERPIRTLVVEETRPNIDWTAGRYLGTSRVRISGDAP